MEILLASPRGFCAGVERAIEIVEQSLKKYGSPIYVKHEIVHNRYVVEKLRETGAIFVEQISEIPENSTVIFSAHGVSKKVVEESNFRNLISIDATCPLVKKVHYAIEKHNQNDNKVILIGHKGHPEVRGTMGQLLPGQVHLVGTVDDVNDLPDFDDMPLAYTTQTTLSIDETKDIIYRLRERFPHIQGPEQGDLCYATTNRQNAVSAMIKQVDLLLIIGSKNSSNSNRLREIGIEEEKKAYLIDGKQDIDIAWFDGVEKVAISSGASAPEILVQEVISFLREKFPLANVKEHILLEEKTHFPLPKELRAV